MRNKKIHTSVPNCDQNKRKKVRLTCRVSPGSVQGKKERNHHPQ